MFIEFKSLFRWIGIGLIALLIWLVWWCQPERQVRRAQRRMLDAIESRNRESFAAILADDYRDRWEHDKANVVRRCDQVFQHFLTLDIEAENRGTEETGSLTWVVRQKLTIKGLGSAVGVAARDRVNQLREPFAMTWRKRGWKPWDWELTAVEQPELEVPRDL
jgi:hypothetical protein